MAYVDADTFRSEKIAMVGLSVTNKNLTSSIKVYPNPATESINVADAATGTKITVYSLDGRMIHQQISSSNIENIKLSNQAAGTYILQLIDPNGQKASTKIIKQ
jgi:membrane carboxypeptidase/penicillin-binding protein PbpC